MDIEVRAERRENKTRRPVAVENSLLKLLDECSRRRSRVVNRTSISCKTASSASDVLKTCRVTMSLVSVRAAGKLFDCFGELLDLDDPTKMKETSIDRLVMVVPRKAPKSSRRHVWTRSTRGQVHE